MLRTYEPGSFGNLSCAGELCDRKALGRINKSSEVTCEGQSRQSDQSVVYVKTAGLGQSGQSNQSVMYVKTVGLGQSRQSNQSITSVEALAALGYK
jgi:hypothetical protein